MREQLSNPVLPGAGLRIATLAAALAATMICSGEARAQYRIGASSSASVSASGDTALYSYNFNDLDQYPGSGSRSVFSPCVSSASVSCFSGGSGPTTSSASLTTAAVSAMASTNGRDFFGTPFDISGSSSASADLATGKVAEAAAGSYYPNQLNGVGSSLAVIADTLTFAAPGGVTDIGVSFDVTGGMTLGNDQASGSLGNNLRFGGALYSDSVCAGCNAPGGLSPSLTGSDIGGWVSYALSPDGLDFSGVYAVTGPTTVISLLAYSGLECQNGATCGYQGVVSFSLPTGVSYTSASGLFGTQAVPEPGAWVLALTGLAMAGGAMRADRGRRRVGRA